MVSLINEYEVLRRSDQIQPKYIIEFSVHPDSLMTEKQIIRLAKKIAPHDYFGKIKLQEAFLIEPRIGKSTLYSDTSRLELKWSKVNQST